MREALTSSDQAIFGAFVPDLVGVVGLYRDRDVKSSHKAHLWGLYVRPEHRSAGVGRTLIEAAIGFARSLAGVSQVHLAVSERRVRRGSISRSDS